MACRARLSRSGSQSVVILYAIHISVRIMLNTMANSYDIPQDPNQSCPSCNTQGIEVMPLQKDVRVPYSA